MAIQKLSENLVITLDNIDSLTELTENTLDQVNTEINNNFPTPYFSYCGKMRVMKTSQPTQKKDKMVWFILSN